MGTWCTEGVKRSMQEHRREESDQLRRKAEGIRQEQRDKGICPECGGKLKTG